MLKNILEYNTNFAILNKQSAPKREKHSIPNPFMWVKLRKKLL